MAIHKNFTSAFRALDRRIASVKRSLPTEIAATGTRFFVENFDKQGFQDATLVPWSPRKNNSQAGRKILIKSGRLRRAVNRSVREKTYRRVIWRITSSEVPYAARHNDGINMPKRQYMGESKALNNRFKSVIISQYNKAFK